MSLDYPKGGKTAKFNDANLYGDFDSLQIQELLLRRFDVLVGLSSKQRRGSWRQWSPTLEELISLKLSHHPESSNKDGHAMVFASATQTGNHVTLKETGMSLPLCGRTRDDLEAVTFAGFDIDGGAELSNVMMTLEDLGYFSIVYTTHSHSKTQSWMTVVLGLEGNWNKERALTEAMMDGKYPNPSIVSVEVPDKLGRARALVAHDPIDKFRILFPLDEPFELNPENPKEHFSLCAEWSDRLWQFSRSVLGVEADEACFDVNRLFYTPRHQPNSDSWFIGIFAGRPLSVDEMPFSDFEQRTYDPLKARANRTGKYTFTGKRPILSDGFDLIDWKNDWGDRFLVTAMLDDLGWEIRRSQGGDEVVLECPNDHSHSNPGDPRDQACWAKDAEYRPFVISCRHNACTDLGSLEMLLLIEDQAALPDEYNAFSEMLCDERYYFQVDDWPIVPCLEGYMRWDPQNDEEADQ